MFFHLFVCSYWESLYGTTSYLAAWPHGLSLVPCSFAGRSLSREGLCPGWVSVQRGLYPGGVSVRWLLWVTKNKRFALNNNTNGSCFFFINITFFISDNYSRKNNNNSNHSDIGCFSQIDLYMNVCTIYREYGPTRNMYSWSCLKWFLFF